MTIYNFNIGIGWASSGVEYAQAYRSNLLKKNKQKSKFIFTSMFYENIQPMTKNIGFVDSEVIWLYQYFTDVKISPTTFTLKDLEAEFTSPAKEEQRSKHSITYYFEENHLRLTAFFTRDEDEEKVFKTETIVGGKLIQRDYFSYVRTFSEYFKPNKGSANLYQRRFFNEDGSIAYDELLNGKQSLYIFKDFTIYSREELIVYFVEQLNLSEKDIIIVDRSTGMGPQIIKGNKGRAKLGVVIHAEHFNEPLTTKEKILWNNYYDYQFENAKVIDFFITATQKQKAILEQQFKDYSKGNIKVFTIPVGSINRLRRKEKRDEPSLITASRLASEKHLDWLIKAVVKAQKEVPQLKLDIYGRGGEEEKLRKLIQDLDAQEFIQLKGQHKLDEIYKNYGTYVSTSTSEGFGLTLLEAVGSGNRMIGFDVRYGNQTFIEDGVNGSLVNYIKNDVALNISNIAQAIVQMYKQNETKLKEMRKESYAIAKPYLTKEIQKLWLELEKEMIND
ncbi:accessory Sec system glycosyltransferase GtfA [Lactococcus sp. DD01]|uniref:accessory Sec system glycosyltransferase GtfA n=1 Tax=Lactococcus sp. DD01 TaxID=1776443 RepID=UPI00077698BA|nr:accessory Sec system glycosyltransferase GtfA [Lactococcus sp. DD01]KXT59354.1 Poly(glycerol-phosphate) alpha-glucosyltransferase GftA [Lactococcus sp. DD01]